MCNKNIILIIIVIIIIFAFLWNKQRENFGENDIEFVGYGVNKYSLTGQKLDVKNVANCFYDNRICYDNSFLVTERNTQPFTPIK